MRNFFSRVLLLSVPDQQVVADMVVGKGTANGGLEGGLAATAEPIPVDAPTRSLPPSCVPLVASVPKGPSGREGSGYCLLIVEWPPQALPSHEGEGQGVGLVLTKLSSYDNFLTVFFSTCALLTVG